MVLHNIDLNSEAIRDFCCRHRIKELSVFGSILREDFRPDSDVDFLYKLEEGVQISLFDWMDMETELEDILGRKAELVSRRSVEESENAYRKDHVLQTVEPIHIEG
jgi:predicted nucleotidyltransferase